MLKCISFTIARPVLYLRMERTAFIYEHFRMYWITSRGEPKSGEHQTLRLDRLLPTMRTSEVCRTLRNLIGWNSKYAGYLGLRTWREETERTPLLISAPYVPINFILLFLELLKFLDATFTLGLRATLSLPVVPPARSHNQWLCYFSREMTLEVIRNTLCTCW